MIGLIISKIFGKETTKKTNPVVVAVVVVAAVAVTDNKLRASIKIFLRGQLPLLLSQVCNCRERKGTTSLFIAEVFIFSIHEQYGPSSISLRNNERTVFIIFV